MNRQRNGLAMTVTKLPALTTVVLPGGGVGAGDPGAKTTVNGGASGNGPVL